MKTLSEKQRVQQSCANCVARHRLPGLTPLRSQAFLGGTTGASDQDDRALTIRKIDEIEALMSKQWWKAQTPPPANDSSSAFSH